jgi:ribonucleoside-triphosphate reductase
LCRASLSPWYVRGGIHPADEDDEPVFVGRFNCGVVSLHLPMILAKAREESKDFYEVLDYYLEMIRQIHKKTKEFLGKKKASINPLGFCQGGFYGGHLKPDECIESLLPAMTFSYGITALNELNRLYNGKSIYEDGQFPLEVMKYINDKINKYKEEDKILYAIYGKRFAVFKLSNLAKGCL